MIHIGDKVFIDSRYTYFVAYFYDESRTLSSLTQVSDSESIKYWEFPDLATAQEYIGLCMDFLNTSDGRMLFQIVERPIKESKKYTNELPIQLIYN